MRILVDVEMGPSEDYSESRRRLRLRYGVLAAATACCTLLFLGGTFIAISQWLADLAWDHHWWVLGAAIAIAVGTSAGRATESYVREYTEGLPRAVGYLVGLATFVLVGLEGDTSLDPISSTIPAVPGGWWGASVVLATFFGILIWLRQANLDYVDYRGRALVTSAALLGVAVLYVVIRLAADQFPWTSAWERAEPILSEFKVPMLALLLISFQAWLWGRAQRRRARAAYEGRLQGEARDYPATGLGTILAIVTLVVILYGLFIVLPVHLVPSDGLSSADQAAAVRDERRTILAVLAAIGAAVTLVFTHLRHQLDRDANATGRYTEAIQQLGNEKSMSIRLGGIYALARLARDSSADRTTIAEVFAAFVRDAGSQDSDGSSGLALDVAAALAELEKLSSMGVATEVDLRRINFSGRKLDSIKFPQFADLQFANFKATELRNASLSGVRLGYSNLEGVRLEDADLAGADLSHSKAAGSDLTNARLGRANLRYADLSGATLTSANLMGADLANANLRGADLSSAFLSGADLSGADFTDAVLNATDLEGAWIYGCQLTPEQLAVARDAEKAIADLPSDEWEALEERERLVRLYLGDESYP